MNQGFKKKLPFQRSRELKGTHRVIAISLAIGGVGLGLLWFFFVSRVWSVTELQIEGLREIERGEVERAVYDILDHGTWNPWDRRNIFFIDKRRFAEDLARKLFVEQVTVDKHLPDILRLIISERQRRVIVALEDQFFSVDTQGVILGSVNGRDLSARLSGRTYADALHAPLILIGLVETATSGERIADSAIVQRWLETFHKLLAVKWRFKTFALERVTSRTCKIAVEGGFDVILDLESPLEPQLETFRRFMQSRTKEMVIHEYVNVTIPGKVSFK